MILTGDTLSANLKGGVVSGSAQVTSLLPSGVISGSSQVNADSITNFDANVLAYNNSLGVVSGSAQITKTLQQVTTAGNTTTTTISITNTTASTSKTTGALLVSGGIGTSGDIFAGGDVVAYASSDKRLKDNILPIENPLQKINQIGGYSFVWNEEKQNIYNGKDYGVIAQEIEEILPELVETRENGYKAVKYEKLVSLLIEGIKDLSKQVDENLHGLRGGDDKIAGMTRMAVTNCPSRSSSPLRGFARLIESSCNQPTDAVALLLAAAASTMDAARFCMRRRS